MRISVTPFLHLLVIGGSCVLAACAPSLSPPTRPQSMLTCNHSALMQNRVPGPAIAAAAYGSISDVPLQAVTMLNSGVFQAIMTQSLYSERLPSNALRVTMRIANCTDAQLHLRARTNFLRVDQVPSEPVSAWQDVYLPPHGLASYQEQSLATTVVASYFVELDAAR
jgi:hypothetical protein